MIGPLSVSAPRPGLAARVALVLGLAGSLVACGGSPPPKAAPASTAKAAPSAPEPPAPPDAAKDHALRRSAVRAVVAGGLGALLQKVMLDDQPVMKDGRFHGFRLAAFADATFFAGVDLHPGDVLVHVNGMPIEHPEQALEVFQSLEQAPELRIEYERDGQPRELKYPIVDDVPRAASADRRADASAP